MSDVADDINALEQALSAGPTPGPWFSKDCHVWHGTDEKEGAITQGGCGCCNAWNDGTYEVADAFYIAAANPGRIQRVVNELKLLRGLLRDCRPYIEDASNDAERAYNDRGGPQYLSPMRLEVKARADALLAQIDAHTNDFPTPPHAAAQPE